MGANVVAHPAYVYTGQTTRSIDIRSQEHVREIYRGHASAQHFHDAISKLCVERRDLTSEVLFVFENEEITVKVQLHIDYACTPNVFVFKGSPSA